MSAKISAAPLYPQTGIPLDYVPVTFSDSDDLPARECIGLYCHEAGNIAVQVHGGPTRVIPVIADTILPGNFTRVLAAGTTVAAGSVFALAGAAA